MQYKCCYSCKIKNIYEGEISVVDKHFDDLCKDQEIFDNVNDFGEKLEVEE